MKQKRKKVPYHTFEIAVHSNGAKSRVKNSNTAQKADKTGELMAQAKRNLNDLGYAFQYKPEWGKAWSSLCFEYKTRTLDLDSDCFDDVFKYIKVLVKTLTPKLNKINWAKTRGNDNKE